MHYTTPDTDCKHLSMGRVSWRDDELAVCGKCAKNKQIVTGQSGWVHPTSVLGFAILVHWLDRFMTLP